MATSPRLPRIQPITVWLLAAVCSATGVYGQDGDENAEKDAGASSLGFACDCDVWAGLYLAYPEGSEPAKSPESAGAGGEERAVVSQLRKAFPDYAGFRLIGESAEPIFKEYECWIVPSRQLFLKIDSLGAKSEENGGVQVHLQLWQENHVLLKSAVVLRQSPVFIAGPSRGEGRLIMVLQKAGEVKAATPKADAAASAALAP